MSSSWVYFGFQPSSVSIFAEVAIKTAGSPALRGNCSTGIGWPVTRRADSTTSPHREALPVSEVVDHPVTLIECLKRQEMRLRQILHVNVVADRSAVRSGVILAKDFDAVTPSDSHIKNQRNQVDSGSWASPRPGIAPATLK